MSLDQLGHAFRALAGFPLIAPLLAETQIVRDSALQRANFSLEFRVGKHQLRKRDGMRPDVLCLGKIYIVRVHESLLPPPAFRERRYSGLARRLVAVRRRAVAVTPFTSCVVCRRSVSPQEAIATAPPPASVHQYPGHSTSVPLLYGHGHAPPRSYEPWGRKGSAF